MFRLNYAYVFRAATGLMPSPVACIQPVEKVIRKKGQKQVKKKAFKINAKIEDVGLTEVWKQEVVN